MSTKSFMHQAALLSASLLLASCDNPATQGGLPVPEAPKRSVDEAQLALGAQRYQQHCARCHGIQAEGDAHWRQRGPDGMFPPPPLNGSGHTWHHSIIDLKDVITQGSPPGKGNMPAWGDKLSEREMEAIIAWLQSLWPDQVYDAWYEMQHRGR